MPSYRPVKATGKDWTEPPYKVRCDYDTSIPEHFPRTFGCMSYLVDSLFASPWRVKISQGPTVKHLWISITYTRRKPRMNLPQTNFTPKNEDAPPGSSNKFSTTQPLVRKEGTGSLWRSLCNGINQSAICAIPATLIQRCLGLCVKGYVAEGDEIQMGHFTGWRHDLAALRISRDEQHRVGLSNHRFLDPRLSHISEGHDQTRPVLHDIKSGGKNQGYGLFVVDQHELKG